MKPDLSVLILNGFGRPSPVTSEVLRTVSQKLETSGVATKGRNLYELSLPLFDGETSLSGIPPKVKDLIHDIRSRHALVIMAPEYHGGMGALVKNAFDWAAMAHALRNETPLFDHRPSALITVSRERHQGIHALGQLGALCHTLGSPVMPGSMGIFDEPSTISSDGGFSEITVSRRLDSLISDLLKVAEKVSLA